MTDTTPQNTYLLVFEKRKLKVNTHREFKPGDPFSLDGHAHVVTSVQAGAIPEVIMEPVCNAR